MRIQRGLRTLAAGLVLTAFGTLAAIADEGDLDTSFHFDGITAAIFGSANEVSRAVAIQPDGKIVLVGSAELTGGTTRSLSLVSIPPGS